MPIFEKRTRIAAPPARVFAFHELPDALQRLTPPWEASRIVERVPAEGLAVGTRVVLEVHVGPIRQRIVAEHTQFDPGRMFHDRMTEGPFARWEHTHLVEPDGAGGAWLVDHVDYALPLGALGQLGGGWFVRRKLDRMFAYRHDVTRRFCEAAT